MAKRCSVCQTNKKKKGINDHVLLARNLSRYDEPPVYRCISTEHEDIKFKREKLRQNRHLSHSPSPSLGQLFRSLSLSFPSPHPSPPIVRSVGVSLRSPRTRAYDYSSLIRLKCCSSSPDIGTRRKLRCSVPSSSSEEVRLWLMLVAERSELAVRQGSRRKGRKLMLSEEGRSGGKLRKDGRGSGDRVGGGRGRRELRRRAMAGGRGGNPLPSRGVSRRGNPIVGVEG